ncbi:MAG: hypothetical protein ACOC0A_00770 [Planctomycetota bacterium]
MNLYFAFSGLSRPLEAHFLWGNLMDPGLRRLISRLRTGLLPLAALRASHGWGQMGQKDTPALPSAHIRR